MEYSCESQGQTAIFVLSCLLASYSGRPILVVLFRPSVPFCTFIVPFCFNLLSHPSVPPFRSSNHACNLIPVVLFLCPVTLSLILVVPFQLTCSIPFFWLSQSDHSFSSTIPYGPSSWLPIILAFTFQSHDCILSFGCSYAVPASWLSHFICSAIPSRHSIPSFQSSRCGRLLNSAHHLAAR